MSELLKRTEAGNLLFAICYEYRTARTDRGHHHWSTGIEYLHAVDAGDARVKYLQWSPDKNRPHVRIVGIAPVVGYHALDDNADRVMV